MQGQISEEEERTLIELAKTHGHTIINAYNAMVSSNDANTFISKIKQRVNFLNQTYIHEARPMTSFSSSRPVSRVRQDSTTAINSSQAMMLGVVHDLEIQSLLDKQLVSHIKTLILEENKEVIKVMNQYFAHLIDERELSYSLTRLSGRLGTYIERPMSPLPKKDTIVNYLNYFAINYIKEKEDMALLLKLVEDENEFVMASFDVFESDMDNENLLDTLKRIVKKYKRMGLSKNSVKAGGFYGEDIVLEDNKLDNDSEDGNEEKDEEEIPKKQKTNQERKNSKQKGKDEAIKLEAIPVINEEFLNHDKTFEVIRLLDWYT